MRTLLAIVAIVGLLLPTYGQQKTGHAEDDVQHAQQSSNPSIAVTVHCSETPLRGDCPTKEIDGTGHKPESYFKTLISANNLPNDLLFLVGLAGIFVAIWTVRTVTHQVDTFVSKERARITVDIEPLDPGGQAGILYDKTEMMPPLHDAWHVDLSIANSGETNAFIRAAFCKACTRQLNWNAKDEVIPSQIGLPKVMRPATTPTKHRNRVEIDRETALAIAGGSLRLCVIGHIEFGDVFDNHWIVKFCHQWGGTWSAGRWQFVSVWTDYEPPTTGPFKMNGEFRVKRPSIFKRILHRKRGEVAVPDIE